MVHFQHYIPSDDKSRFNEYGLFKVQIWFPPIPQISRKILNSNLKLNSRQVAVHSLMSAPALLLNPALQIWFHKSWKFLEIFFDFICKVLILRTTFWPKMSLYIYKFSSFYRLVYWWIVIKSSCIFGRFDVNKHPFCEERCESRWLLWRWVWQSGQGGHLPYWTLYGAWFEPDFILLRRPYFKPF